MLSKLCNANLQNQDFRSQNLPNEDFSGADIRGLDFTNANLTGANFSKAKAGLPSNWRNALIAFVILLAFIAGTIASYAGALIGNSLGTSLGLGIFALIALFVYLATILLRGLGTTLATLILLVSGCLVFSIALLPENNIGNKLAVASLFIAVALPSAISGLSGIAIAIAISKAIQMKLAKTATGIVAFFGIIVGILFGVRPNDSFVYELLTALLASLSTAIIGSYIGGKSIFGDKKYALIRVLAIRISTAKGTKFCGANLTDANFTEANLKNTEFRKANLTRTNWFHAQGLDQAHTEQTYLEIPKIRDLLVTKDGHGKNFEHLDLRGLNLKDANLEDASLVGADLGESTLEKANLARAKLVKTQLYKTNLSNACLTGAYIENWGISTETQLDGVQCDYIYMQLPSEQDPDPCRKPDDKKKNFNEGDFADFIAPIIKTLNLYRTQNIDPRQIDIKFKTLDLLHYNGIDPSAAALALKQVAENNPEAELEVVALEGRGSEKVRLQTVVSGNANRSELYKEYFERYDQIKSLPYSDLQALLAGVSEKDERIRSLEKLLENALQQPKFYVETYQNQGEFIMAQENKGNVNISGVQGNISGIAAAGENQTMTGVALGAISGNVTNTISQLPDTTDPNEPSLKELLTQLQTLIESESELNEEDKVEALEQVKVLAESAQKPENSTLQKLAKTAVKILKGTIASLPERV